MSRLVLASRSPARAKMLTDAGVNFSVDAADVDEATLKMRALQGGATPMSIALHLAEAKALAIAPRHGGLTIGADQTLELEGRLFDKPPNVPAARDQLLALRGRTHQLHAAVVLAQGDQVLWSTVQSVSLTVRAFSDAFVDAYLAAEGDALLGCVGAYRLEGPGSQLFERIEGDYFTVLGLPLLPLLAALRAQGLLAR